MSRFIEYNSSEYWQMISTGNWTVGKIAGGLVELVRRAER